MDFALTPEQTALREQLVEFARRELTRGACERDRQAEFPRDLWEKCGRMGLQGLPVPEQHGGLGLDPVHVATALEAFGYACPDGGLVFSVCAHLLACVVPIWLHGSEKQRRELLPGLCDGSLIATNAMTEPTSGSDAFNLATHALPEGDGFRITGCKTFCTNGPVADVALVYASVARNQYPAALTAFLVRRGLPGFSVGQRFDKMGLRSSPISELVFENVRVEPDDVLGGVGAGATIFSESMDWERALLPAAHVGAMERLLEESVRYARTRRAFGKSIGKFQAVSHRIADMKVRLDAARLLTYRAASRLGTSRDVARDAAIAKLFVSESLVGAALDTVRVLGGYGYMQEYEVERTLRDAVGGVLYSGTSDMQRNIIAGWLGL